MRLFSPPQYLGSGNKNVRCSKCLLSGHPPLSSRAPGSAEPEAGSLGKRPTSLSRRLDGREGHRTCLWGAPPLISPPSRLPAPLLSPSFPQAACCSGSAKTFAKLAHAEVKGLSVRPLPRELAMGRKGPGRCLNQRHGTQRWEVSLPDKDCRDIWEQRGPFDTPTYICQLCNHLVASPARGAVTEHKHVVSHSARSSGLNQVRLGLFCSRLLPPALGSNPLGAERLFFF